MAILVVDVVFRGKVLETLPFDAPTLRIGRMPENDVVLDNLGVSRFHARLHRDERRVVLEDAGSGNGCLVNGERVEERREIALGDRISIGKHELVVRRAIEGDPLTARPARRKSDAWDGGRTYVLGAPSAPPAAAAPPATPVPATPSTASSRKEPPAMTPPPASRPAASAAAPLDPALDSPEIDFDFVGSLADDAGADVASPVTTPLPAAEATPSAGPALHAGFIVQRDGKLDRVSAWGADIIVAGRSSDCDLVLAQDEVSRRHARFERAADRYEVRDLGSVNGTFVNGRRVEQHTLRSGDVVQIEGFQLTFVLDRDPIDGAVAAQPAATAQPAPRREDTFAMTMLQEAMPHRPGFTELLAKPAPGEDPIADGEVEVLAEADLLPDELEDAAQPIGAAEPEKPEEAAVSLRGASSRATSVQNLAISNPNLAREPELCFELRVRMDLLPPALRSALEEAGASELVLPAELRLRT